MGSQLQRPHIKKNKNLLLSGASVSLMPLEDTRFKNTGKSRSRSRQEQIILTGDQRERMVLVFRLLSRRRFSGY